MRKTLIALILVLPMAFVLVIFTSVNAVSLGVNIAVNGIRIRAEGADETNTLLIDMADRTEHTVTAEVLPGNATEKGYTLSSSDEDVLGVNKDGLLLPHAEGTATVTAKSNDKSFTDSVSVAVISSKPYDFTFSLFGEDGEDLLTATEEGYEATLPAGTYSYSVSILPVEYTQYALVKVSGEHAEISQGTRSIFLPFSGDVELEASVPDGVRGDIVKKISLHVIKPKDAAIIDGKIMEENATLDGITLASGTRETQLFVECSGGMQFVADDSFLTYETTNTGGGRYILDIAISAAAEGSEEQIPFTIWAGGNQYTSFFSFAPFAFRVTSDREMTEDGDRQQVMLLTGNAATFYAVASGGAKDVGYTWKFEGPEEYFTLGETGDTATVKIQERGDFSLTVTAVYLGKEYEQTVSILARKKIGVVQIAGDLKTDLAAHYTIAGMAWTDGMELKENTFPLTVYTYSSSGVEPAGEDIVYSVSDGNIAAVEKVGGKPVLVPKGTGTVTVTAAWEGNEAFHTNVRGQIAVEVVKEAVAVTNAPQLNKAMEQKLPAVLMNDIKLGTDGAGNPFTDGQLIDVLKSHRMKSTYNTEWYKHATDGSTEQDAYLSYVLEFTNSVYGNGKSIDADNFTHHVDASGKPMLKQDGNKRAFFGGPLYFVKYNEMASVAGQDNCAFLIRTDNVKLYGVDLLGCSDDSLLNADGGYDLSNLDLTGTVLEVNASCEIVNCRIRNGRNVVRAYGGNRNGDKYFIDSLSANNAGVDGERIRVTIAGCILSQGREFLLKMGANRALRASLANGQEPPLKDQSGKAYPETGTSNRYGKLYEDPYFYSHYVLTDLTLKDSVRETSGLFTVGIESNFSGEYLYKGGSSYNGITTEWEYSGGTSFASVLRLEGDVRLYDWKDLSLVDSSTLIESPMGQLKEWLKLDIKSMLDFVSSRDAAYGDVIETVESGADKKQYVHGGIALYGGGRNYAAVDMSKLKDTLGDFLYLNVNIAVLADGTGSMQQQGTLLPKAAGTHDFNFYMYGKNSKNNYLKQRNDELRGEKYTGVTAFPAFEKA